MVYYSEEYLAKDIDIDIDHFTLESPNLHLIFK